MVAKKRKVIWPALAQVQLQKAFDYICQDSVQNAIKVKKQYLNPPKG